jgi:Putative zincin peptidase
MTSNSATQTLPTGYKPGGSIDLSRDRRLNVAVNLVALAGLVGASWLALYALRWLRPGYRLPNLTLSALTGLLMLIGIILLLTTVMVVLHEGIHGLFFWVFARRRPVFGMRGTYAFAAMPGWYFPRRFYLLIGLAPLVILTLSGLALIAWGPAFWIPGLLFVLVMNASGSVGDLYIILWLLTKPAGCLVQDYGDGVIAFVE